MNYNRSLRFHGGDTGSTPIRDASEGRSIARPPRRAARTFWELRTVLVTGACMSTFERMTLTLAEFELAVKGISHYETVLAFIRTFGAETALDP